MDNFRGDGRRFEGEFRDGKMDGKGVKYGENGKVEAKGVWFEGKFYKKGKKTRKMSNSVASAETVPK